MATENVFQSATAIVESTYLDHADPLQPEASRPAQSNLVRIANRARERVRPKEPQSLDFEVSITTIIILIKHFCKHVFFNVLTWEKQILYIHYLCFTDCSRLHPKRFLEKRH